MVSPFSRCYQFPRRMEESLRGEMSGNLDRARRAWARHRVAFMAAGILVLMALNLISVTARKSITTDEFVLIPSAYYHLVTDEIQLIRQHPPLCKLLAGLPLLFIQPQEWAPPKIAPSDSPDKHEWECVVHFWRDNWTRFPAISFWSRVPMIGLTLALGLLIFIFTRDLFGPRAALLALLLFAVEPTILAHGRVVQTDIPAAFGLLLSIFAVYRYWQAPTWRNAAGVGGAAAIAMLAKYSMLILGPALLVLLVVRSEERRVGKECGTRVAA